MVFTESVHSLYTVLLDDKHVLHLVMSSIHSLHTDPLH